MQDQSGQLSQNNFYIRRLIREMKNLPYNHWYTYLHQTRSHWGLVKASWPPRNHNLIIWQEECKKTNKLLQQARWRGQYIIQPPAWRGAYLSGVMLKYPIQNLLYLFWGVGRGWKGIRVTWYVMGAMRSEAVVVVWYVSTRGLVDATIRSRALTT